MFTLHARHGFGEIAEKTHGQMHILGRYPFDRYPRLLALVSQDPLLLVNRTYGMQIDVEGEETPYCVHFSSDMMLRAIRMAIHAAAFLTLARS